MGYYVSLHSSDFAVKESPELLSALKEMPVKYHAIKRGGSSSGESWFSWVNDSEFEQATSAQQIIEAFGFETTEAQGEVTLDGYQSKTGQEDLLLAVLAPFANEGAEMEWSGEEGERWLYIVRGGKLWVSGETRRWDDPVPYKYAHYDFYKNDKDEYVTKSYSIDPYLPVPDEIVSRWEKKKTLA